MLAQYALFDLVSTARHVWGGLLEIAGLVPDGELDDGALAAGSQAVRDTPRLTAAMDCHEGGPPRWQAPLVTENQPRGGPSTCCTLDWI